MNNTFNINRFGLLIKRQWLEFGKIYLIGLVILIGVLTGIYALSIPKLSDGLPRISDGYMVLNFRYPLFMISGFLFISVIASTYFSNLGQKSKAIIDLMIPASVFEKFLAGILYSAVLSICSYLLIYFVVDHAFCAYLNDTFKEFSNYTTSFNQMGKTIKFVGASAQTLEKILPLSFYSKLIFIPLMITSVFFLGSVYFNKFHYIKTAVSVVVSIGILVYLIGKVHEMMSRNTIRIANVSHEKQEDLWILFAVTASITLFFWIIAYVRLKEKEI